jgi:hypothetical protein
MAVYHRTQRLQIYGEKPEVTKLFGDRYRMVVRCKAARDTEAWYNANKDQIFASFGTLYSAQMSVDGIDPRVGEAYPDMCLVSNSASYTQTGEYVISFVYETLTAVWTKEQGDEVTSTDNGLRVLERSEVAKVDGFPIVQLSSPNSSKVVLSGMGNASNYFVLLVKANSANTIYWRATNEALATYNGSFTTANTDQWEYKVIYTPISIDQLEIGYNGTNYSTFDLSEFYLVSQSSDWQNNIVESFIEFEVTVDNSSPFTDTVVFTGSNGNTATGTNVQGGGTGSISSPYDEDDVGVSTITNGGKTLYLASFQDQTGAESNAQVGRVVTRWAESGTLSTNKYKISNGVYELTTTFLAVEGTTIGPIIRRREDDVDGLKTISVTELLDGNGDSIIEGGSNEVMSYDEQVNFTVPGLVKIRQSSVTTSKISGGVYANTSKQTQNYGFELVPPVATTQTATKHIIYTTTASIGSGDLSYDSSYGFWNPVSWAQSIISGVNDDGVPFYESKAYKGYRSSQAYLDVTNRSFDGWSGGSRFRFGRLLDSNGNEIINLYINGYKVAKSPQPNMELLGGPENPVGRKWVLSVDVSPEFETVEGVQIYRKIITTSTIDGKNLDEDLVVEQKNNSLSAYAVTDEGNGYYSVVLNEAYQEEDNVYNGSIIRISRRAQTSLNEYLGPLVSVVYDYDAANNKLLLKLTTPPANIVGKYLGSGDVASTSNFELPRFLLEQYVLSGTVVATGLNKWIQFDENIAPMDFTGWDIEFTSGTANGNTYDIDEKSLGTTRKFGLSDTISGIGVVAGDTFTLIPPETF